MISKDDLLKHGADKAEGFACRANHEVFSDEWIVTLSNYKLGYQAALDLLWPVLCEARGILSAHEIAIRQDSGNTNLECYNKALSELAEKVRGGE